MICLAEKILPSLGMAECVDPTISDADWEALGIDPENAAEIILQAQENSVLALQFAVDVA